MLLRLLKLGHGDEQRVWNVGDGDDATESAGVRMEM